MSKMTETIHRRLSFRFALKWFHFILMSISPAIGLFWARIMGRISYLLFFDRPSQKEVGAIFGDLKKSDLSQIARDITINKHKKFILRNLMIYGGIKRLFPLIECHGVDKLINLHKQQLPAILIFGHIGPSFAILAKLSQLGIPALILKYRNESWIPEKFEVYTTRGGPDRKAFILKSALDYLRTGGFVLIAIDERVGTSECEVTFMGRKTTFRRGFATLSRLTGAPVIPTIASWSPQAKYIDLTFYDPLSTPDLPPDAGIAYDNCLVAEAAQWLEERILSDPGLLTPKHLRRYVQFFG